MSFNKGKISPNSLKGKSLYYLKQEMIIKTINTFSLGNTSILILDDKSSKIISSFLTMSDVLSLGIFSVDSINKQRKPYPKFSGIYFISTSDESIKSLLKDYEKNPLYKRCHVFFCEIITDEQLNKLVKKNFINRILTCKELNLTFITPDQNLYCFGEINYVNSLYQIYINDLNNDFILNSVNHLISICSIMNLMPNIVYFSKEKMCEKLAKILNKKLREKYKNKSKKGILLITTRLLDLTAPLLYDLTYGTILFNTYENENYNQIKFKDKNITLDETDQLYIKYRNSLLPNVLSGLVKDFDDFRKSDISKIGKGEKLQTFDEMRDAVKNIGEYKYQSNLFSNHLSLAEEVSNKGKEIKILNIIDTQNTILSGCDNKGKVISNKEILIELKNIQNYIQTSDMVRLLSITKYFHETFDIDDAITTFNEGKKNNINIKSKDKETINFFSYDNTQISKKDLNDLDREIVTYRQNNNYKTKEEIDNKNDKRYLCCKESKLTTLIDMCSKNKLPNNLFQFVETPENLNPIHKKTYETKLLNNDEEDNNFNDDKLNLILFNIGGISRYEICSIEKGNLNGQFNYNVIIGANKIYNCQDYIKEIENFKEGKYEIKNISEENDNTEYLHPNDVKLEISNDFR